MIIAQNERNTDMYTPLAFLTGKIFPVYGTTHPVHVLEKETVYMKNNMEIKITEIKNDTTLYTRAQLYT